MKIHLLSSLFCPVWVLVTLKCTSKANMVRLVENCEEILVDLESENKNEDERSEHKISVCCYEKNKHNYVQSKMKHD